MDTGSMKRLNNARIERYRGILVCALEERKDEEEG